MEKEISRKVREGIRLSEEEICRIESNFAELREMQSTLRQDIENDVDDKDVKQTMINSLSTLPKSTCSTEPLPSGHSAKILMSVSMRKSLMEATNNWRYDVRYLNAQSNNRALSTLLCSLFQDYDLFDRLHIDINAFRRFSRELETSYRAVPFHNSLHAAFVLQMVNMLLTKGGILTFLVEHLHQTEQDQSLVLAAMFIAAAGHDVCHAGQTNDFQVRLPTNTAIEFNDISCNENMHAKTTWKFVNDCKIFENLDRGDRQIIRTMMINCILRTDMKNHIQVIRQFYAVRVNFSNGRRLVSDDILTIMQMCLKCADLAHLAMPREISSRWVSCLEEEMFRQGDLEKLRNLPISPLMDRTQPGIWSAQEDFMQAIAKPTFKSMMTLFEDTSVLYDGICANHGLKPIEEAMDNISFDDIDGNRRRSFS